jgi:hypothetical protein
MFAGHFGPILPARKQIRAALQPNAVPDVVSENNVVSRHDALRDQFRKSDQILFVRREKIVRVAAEDELIAGMAVVELDNAVEPWRQCGSGTHSI